MKFLTEKKTNKSMAIVSFALIALPIIAKVLRVVGYPEWAEIVDQIVIGLGTAGAGTGLIGLVAKKRRGEKVFTS